MQAPFNTRVPAGNFLPPRLVFPIALAVIVLTVLGSMEPADPRRGLTWAGIHLGTIVLAGLVVVLAKVLVFSRGARTVSLGFMVGTALVTGVTKAVTTAGAEEYFGLTDQWTDNLGARLIGATIAATWLVLFTTYADIGLERLARAREELVQANVATRLQTGHPAYPVELDQTIVRMRALKNDFQTGGSLPASSAIHEVVDDTIRPMSRLLYSAENARYPSVTMSSFLEASIQSGRLPALWIAVLWTTTAFTPLATTAGFMASAVQNITIGLLAYFTWRFAPRVMPKHYVGSLAAIGALSGGIVLLGAVVSTVVAPALELGVEPLNVLVGAIWMFLAATGLSVVSGALNITKVIRHDLGTHETKNLMEQQSQNLSSALAKRNLAATLHGEVQSRLLGIATAIDHRKLSAEALRAELDTVIDSLERLNAAQYSEKDEHHQQSAAERLSGLSTLWQGMLTVDIEPDSQRKLLHAIEHSPDIIEILREALTNAHRHGRATSVTITFREEGNQAHLTVRDNGYGPRNGPPGLGLTLLDSWSNNRWELTEAPDSGAKLRVTLNSPTTPPR